MHRFSSVALMLMGVLWSASPAMADPFAAEARLSGRGISYGGPAGAGGELEFRPPGFPGVLSLEAGGDIRGHGERAWSVVFRTASVVPTAAPQWGWLAGVGGGSTYIDLGPGSTPQAHPPGVLLGFVWQQRWDRYWLRLSPNLILTPDRSPMMPLQPFFSYRTLIAGVPWVEFGWAIVPPLYVVGRTSMMPIGLAWMF